MNKLSIYTLLFVLLSSCQGKQYQPEECGQSIPISNTKTLTISDTLIGYEPIGTFDTSFDQIKHPTLILFKSKPIPSATGLYNDEITYKKIGEIAKENNIDVLIETDYKIAHLYGVELAENAIKQSILIIANENKVIQEIYENACEEDIIRRLNQMQTDLSSK